MAVFIEKFLEVELQGQNAVLFFSWLEVISLPSTEAEPSNGPQRGGGVSLTTRQCPRGLAPTPGPLLTSQVEDGTGRRFFTRIFLRKSIVEPVFI